MKYFENYWFTKGEKLKEKLFHENEKEIEKPNKKINIIVSKNIFNKK